MVAMAIDATKDKQQIGCGAKVCYVLPRGWGLTQILGKGILFP